MRNATVIRHLAFEDLGSLAEILEKQDYAVTYKEAGLDNLAQLDPERPDLLIILGGPIGVDDEADYPFLRDELQLIEHRLKAELPTLGICLGAQLMARALGASVYSGEVKEIGWLPLKLTTEGMQSPLKFLSSEQTSMLHWHGDTFDLPTGAILLASTINYQNQAFAWGKNCLALQFHPEVTAGGLERWFIGHTVEISATSGISIPRLRADTAKNIDRLETQAHYFWQDWLSQLEFRAK